MGLQLLQKASRVAQSRGFSKTLKLYPILSGIFTALWSLPTYEDNFVNLLNISLAETNESIHNFYLLELLNSYNEERATDMYGYVSCYSLVSKKSRVFVGFFFGVTSEF